MFRQPPMTRPNTTPGIDVLLRGGRASDRTRAAVAGLRHARLGLIAHPASVTSGLHFSGDAIRAAGYDLCALFGPQHGARGERQDNMIESGHYADPVTGLPVHSLYGDVRKPTPAMLEGLDAVLFDLQDVGVRVYTFVWTMALAMEACAEAGYPVRRPRPPQPGRRRPARRAPCCGPGYESFVGLHPVPLRHGLTCGEMARWLNEERGIGCDLDGCSLRRLAALPCPRAGHRSSPG